MSENDRKGPDYTAFSVREYAKDKSAWDRIGAGFAHRDGQGVDVILNSLPLDGRVTLREARKEEFKAQRSEENNERRPSRERRR